MADIFIAYSSQNSSIVEKLYTELSSQWDVIYDYLAVDDFSDYIERKIADVKCVVPIFSAESRESDYFIDEIQLAKKLKKQLVAVKLDESDNPLGFGRISFCDFRGWQGCVNHKGFKQLQQKLSSVAAPRAKPTRPASIENGKVLLPTLFQSVSSFETQLRPAEAIKALKLFGTPATLVSAYDLVERNNKDYKKLKSELKKYKAAGGFVLIDSGNYERSRLNDESWQPADLEEALKDITYDWAFCFDALKPHNNHDKAVNQVVSAVKRDQKFSSAPVFPIVHAQQTKKGEYILDNLPNLIVDIATQLQPTIIAIPERELGDGIVKRVKTVQEIRSALGKLPFYQPIHLLGTGNPLTIPLFVAAGADTFDGLEWCRMVVDRKEHRLNHFQHFDFFTYQTELADSIVAREALHDKEVNFFAKVIFHNLDYYTDFMCKLRSELADGNVRSFVGEEFSKDIVSQIKELIPGLLK